MGGEGAAMQTKDWRAMNRWIEEILERRTGQTLEAWNSRVRDTGIEDPAELRVWLQAEGVTGYPLSLLVRERFGHPDFFLASADELIEGQYRDRPELRPIFDAVLAQVSTLGDVTVQARKTYVSLVTPRRTFAVVQPTTRKRIDLGFRLALPLPATRLQPPTGLGSGNMTAKIGLTSAEEVDEEVLGWLRRAYEENR
jgi:hypothetical protein